MDTKYSKFRNDKRQTKTEQQRSNLSLQLTLQNLYLR